MKKSKQSKQFVQPIPTTSTERNTMARATHTRIALKNPIATTTAGAYTTPSTTPAASPPTSSTAPATSSSSVVTGMTPPVVPLPSISPQFIPVDLASYRGTHPRQLQLALIPGAVAEIQNSTVYQSTLGPAAPDGPTFATTLDTGMGWTTLRISLENFLVYVKSQEAVAWKSGMTMIDQAKVAYDAIVVVNPAVTTTLPELSKLLEVGNTIGKKGNATRKRNKSAKVATTTAATTARTESTPTPAAVAAPNPLTTTVTTTSGGTSS